MRIYYYILITTILILTVVIQASANDFISGNVEFNHLTVSGGLPNNRVDCMIQDYEGYLWFGTKRGLCRYNGYDFKNYTSILNDTTSLRYHQISTLLESSDSTLWIGTWDGGLHKYNRNKDNFIRINLGIPNSLINNITQLFEDSKGGIWVATAGKLFLLKKAQNNIVKEITQEDGTSSLVDVSAFYEDNNGIVFIAGDYPSPLYAYNPEKELTSRFELTSATGILPRKINQVYSFDENIFWFAADNGLFDYNRETGLVGHIDQEKSPNQGTQVNFILPTDDGKIWLGGNGLYTYNKREKQFKRFTHFAGNSQTISGNLFTYGFRDNQKNLWFGTFGQGINVIYHKTKHFNNDYDLTEKLEKASKNITAIYKNDAGSLFLGTWDKGLLILNEKNEFVHSEEKFSGLSHLKNRIVRSISADKNGVIWIGSENDLLTRFELRNNKTDIYSITGFTNNTESQINSILTDSQSRIWVTNPTGVFLFEPATGTFSNLLSDANTQNIMEDSCGNIWCANYNTGLCRISADNSVSYFKSEGKNSNLPNAKFVCIFRDSRERMWVGTEFNGLFLYHPGSDSFQQFTVKDGLPSNDICSIKEDSKGRLWIGTNNGLSRFNYDLNDFSNYFRNDGINADEFNYNASFKSNSGNIYFGCTNGFVFFDPDDIRGSYLTFPIKLEDIAINYGAVTEDMEGVSIREALTNNTPLKLRYNQNTIDFKYSTLNYSNAPKSNFAYQLVGLDDDFNQVQNLRQVTYANLKPGKYTFKVIASNNDNIWDREGTAIAFQIKNPPWYSWWAYTIYGLIIILIFYALRYQVRHEEKMKAAIHLERMEKNQQKELTQMKLRFFTNISHEFKTPLTLIIGPLEQIITELHGNSGLKTKLIHISANSKRLLKLINQLIDFRKIEQDALPLEKSPNDLVETMQNIMVAFNPTAIKNEIFFSLDTGAQSLVFNYDRDKIEKILTNLLSNAFKYTSCGGSVSICLQVNDKSKVNITISDTGSGIESTKMTRIFERFNSAADSENKLEIPGSGIGLAYSKKLAELHKGSLKLESKPEKGTTVIIELPYDTHLLPNSDSITQRISNPIITTPLESSVKTSHTEEVQDSLAEVGNAPHILVVEDDKDLRKYIVSILTDLYHVDEAQDGLIGYRLAVKNDYDLIVSDVMMPNMSGTQLCGKLKSNLKTSHIHVILLTAQSDITCKIKGYETGSDSYITKPFLPKHLIQVIKNLLNTRQHIKSYFSSSEEISQEPQGIHPRDKEFIANAIAFIEKNIDVEKFGVEALGKELGLSRTHLFRKFKSLTGTAPNDFIRQVRLKKAAQLINERKYLISEIAYMVGFKTPANFSTSFKAFYGKSPKKYLEDSKFD